MIVWIASYPRSGNTMFRMYLKELYGQPTYSQYNDREFFAMGAADEIGHKELPMAADQLTKAKELYFVKTHDLPTDSEKAIYLIRDGRDAICSLAYYLNCHQKGFRDRIFNQMLGMIGRHPVQQTLRDLITSDDFFGGWSGNVEAWMSRGGGQTAFLKYEEMLRDPFGSIAGALAAIDVDLTPNPNPRPVEFAKLQQRWPTFFRRGKTGDWPRHLTGGLHELFWKHHECIMNKLGYHLDGCNAR